jgi:hypothetical protein
LGAQIVQLQWKRCNFAVFLLYNIMEGYGYETRRK